MYKSTEKKNILNNNPKQTVIVEVVITDNKKTCNVYLGNYKRRQDAYYLGMVPNEMKEVRKGETKKHYRLLKLFKLLAEVGVKGYNTKTNYFITEDYDEAVVVKREAPATAPEVPAEESPEEVEVVA